MLLISKLAIESINFCPAAGVVSITFISMDLKFFFYRAIDNYVLYHYFLLIMYFSIFMMKQYKIIKRIFLIRHGMR